MLWVLSFTIISNSSNVRLKDLTPLLCPSIGGQFVGRQWCHTPLSGKPFCRCISSALGHRIARASRTSLEKSFLKWMFSSLQTSHLWISSRRHFWQTEWGWASAFCCAMHCFSCPGDEPCQPSLRVCPLPLESLRDSDYSLSCVLIVFPGVFPIASDTIVSHCISDPMYCIVAPFVSGIVFAHFF